MEHTSESRGPRARAAGARSLAGAVVLAAAALCWACGGGSAEAAPPEDREEASPSLEFPPLGRRPVVVAPAGEGAAPRDGRPPAAGEDDARSSADPGRGTGAADRARPEALSAAVERIVQNAVAAARDRTEGKAHGGNCQVSVHAVDLQSGEVLVDRLGGAPVAPASNMKVLTAAAALIGLEPGAAFETRFEAHGEVRGGTLEGDLVVRAGADPLHDRGGTGDLGPWFDPLVARLRAEGIERIAGRIVLDHGPFTALGPGPQWPDPSQHWQDYCGLAAGFTAGGGCFRVTVTSDDTRARVVLRPRHHGLERRGKVSVGGKVNALAVGANAAGVTVRGKVPPRFGPYVREFSHPDPVQLFAASLEGALREQGIRSGGVVVPDAEHPARDRSGRLLHVMRSPVEGALRAILEDSNNPVTDQLYLLLGARLGGGGTREGGALGVRRALLGAGIATEGLVQVDGSGLSKANRLSARTLVGVLSAVEADPAIRGPFRDGLSHVGVDDHTGSRMSGTPAERRALVKTGWVAGASSLSGYVLDPEGRPRIAFAILVAYPRLGGLNPAVWKPMQDELCVLFTGHVDRGGGRR